MNKVSFSSFILIAFLGFIGLWPAFAYAQVFSDKPLCLTLYNSTDGEVLGHIETDEYHDAAGKLSWHRSNFRLAASGSQEVCATGPFFEGYRLRVVVKTVMPLYSCKTEIGRKVTISRTVDDYGLKTLVMDCPSEKGATTAPAAK